MSKRLIGELITFFTDDQMPLHGFLVRRKSKKCMIIIHGMGGNFYSSQRLPYFAEAFKEFSVFSINTRGHDDVSSTKRVNGTKHIRTGTGTERFEESILDISAAIRIMWRMGFRKIVLIGHSTGCQKILYYQYKRNDRRVKALVLLGPADDYSLGIADKKKFRKTMSIVHDLQRKGKANVPSPELGFFSPNRIMSVSSLKNVESRMLYYDGKLAEFSSITTPICAIFGSEEEYRDRDVSEYLKILSGKTHSKNYRSIVIDGAAHSFSGYEAKTANRIKEWLDEVTM